MLLARSGLAIKLLILLAYQGLRVAHACAIEGPTCEDPHGGQTQDDTSPSQSHKVEGPEKQG